MSKKMNRYVENSGKKRSGHSRKRKKKSLFTRFVTLVALIVCIFLAGSTAVLLGASAIQRKNGKGTGTDTENATQTAGNETLASQEPEKTRLNVAVFGVDKDGYRTDVIFIVSYDTKDQSMDVVSVPRDTKVTMTQEIQKGLEERDRTYPSGGVCKLNEVHAYAGEGYRNEYSVLQLEDLLGITIDNYVKIDLDGFQAVVDAVGGVDVDVPQDMDYEDPYQDLYIHLSAGMQHLDGAKAEGLVRYREGYVQKDLARIQVQQSFLKALLKKITSTETILQNLPSLVYTMFKYVDTDLSVGEALKYIKYVKDLDMSKVNMETIPGEGGSYFTVDQEGLEELVQRVFYDVDQEEELPGNGTSQETAGNGTAGNGTAGNGTAGNGTVQKEDASSKSYRIEVSNGGYVNGLAAKKQTVLEDAGYYVPGISTYYGEKEEKTRIFVKTEGMGEDLLAYFPGAVLETRPQELSTGTDIKVVLGTDEK